MHQSPVSDRHSLVPRKYNREGWGWTVCECGKKLRTLRGEVARSNAHHYNSVRHQHHKRLRALLATNCLTLEEIGKRLGVSRERVRQLANELGINYDGPARRSACVLSSREQRMYAEINKLTDGTRLGRFVQACADHGLSCDLVDIVTTGPRFFSTNRLLVNGKLVIVKGVQPIERVDGHYIRIVGSNMRGLDLLVYELPDGRWLFRKPWGDPKLVRDKATGREHQGSVCTMFRLRDVQAGEPGYTYTRRHDFYRDIEAWHYL